MSLWEVISAMMLSVIIPVYNVEDYIENCVRSVLAAVETWTQNNIEIICIDDGSKDESGLILDGLAKEINSRSDLALLRVVHCSNAGVSASRNVALDMARGKYIAFVDSDDCLTGEILGNAISAMECDTELDVWIGQRRVISDNGCEMPNERQPCSIRPMVSTTPIRDFRRINGRYWLYSVIGKLFRGDVIRGNKLRFHPGLNIGEDALFMAMMYSLSRKVLISDDVFYLRRLHTGSLISRDWANLVPQYYMAMIELERFAREHGLIDKVGPLVAQWAMSRFRVLFDRGYSFDFKARYIDALVKHSDFKKALLRCIVKYAPLNFSIIAMLMMFIPGCFIRTGLKGLVRVRSYS